MGPDDADCLDIRVPEEIKNIQNGYPIKNSANSKEKTNARQTKSQRT